MELFAPLAIFDIPICYVCSQNCDTRSLVVRSDGIIGNRCIFISFRNLSQWPPIYHMQYSFRLCVQRFLSTKWINLILNRMNLTGCIWDINVSNVFNFHLEETHLCRWKIGNEMKQNVCFAHYTLWILFIVHTYTKCIDHQNKQQQSFEQCFLILNNKFHRFTIHIRFPWSLNNWHIWKSNK